MERWTSETGMLICGQMRVCDAWWCHCLTWHHHTTQEDLCVLNIVQSKQRDRMFS